jgi:hypothetical protein
VGSASIVFMKATGVATLSAWDAAITKAALQLYHTTVSQLLPGYCGYVVEMAEELSLCAFQSPEAAIAWALAARASLLAADWPAELLEHELCEPITTTLVTAAAVSTPVWMDRRTDKRTDRWMEWIERTHYLDGWTDGRTDRGMEWMERTHYLDAWTDRRTEG